MSPQRVILKNRFMDIFFYRMISPVEDAAGGEVGEPRCKRFATGIIKFFLKELVDKGS